MSAPARRLPLAAAVLAGALAAPAAADATVLAEVTGATRVAAHEGTVMWSAHDPATGDYTLVRSVGGGPARAVGVPPRDTPFDVDLGSNRAGSTYAVYTRDGDLVRLNPRTGVEQRLTSLSSPDAVERDPSIHLGEIAFIRRENGRDHLRRGDTTRTGTPTRRITSARSIVSAEIGYQHIAYVTDDADDFRQRSVHVRNLRTGNDHVVHRARSGGLNSADVTKPSYVSEPREGFVFARTNTGSGTGNRILRYTLRGSRLEEAPGSSRWNSSAWAGRALGLVTSSSLGGGEAGAGACSDAGVRYCRVELTGPLEFTRMR